MQAPPFGAVSPVAARALKTDSCLSIFLLLHLGQLILSRVDKTMVSKCWSQPRQVYSKIGITPRFARNLKLQISHHTLGMFGFGLGVFGGDVQGIFSWDRYQ